MNRTLPLFQELEPHGGHRPGSEAAAAPREQPVAARDEHLRAAWRLSRSMKKFRDGSPEQTRAGLAICRHLVACLRQDTAA